jgi:hypothetical protein
VTTIVVDVEILTENTKNSFVTKSTVFDVEMEILIQNKSLLCYCEATETFYFSLVKVRDFLIWNRISLCNESFVMTPIDQVIRIGDDA